MLHHMNVGRLFHNGNKNSTHQCPHSMIRNAFIEVIFLCASNENKVQEKFLLSMGLINLKKI